MIICLDMKRRTRATAKNVFGCRSLPFYFFYGLSFLHHNGFFLFFFLRHFLELKELENSEAQHHVRGESPIP